MRFGIMYFNPSKKYQYLYGILHNCGLSISELDLQPCEGDSLRLWRPRCSILDSAEGLDVIDLYNRMHAAVFVSFLVGRYVIVGAAVTQK